ncbi:MAG: GntR family transcriptional regulator [Amylibacter sp.]
MGYRDIHGALLARIRSGDLLPGALLPNELELAVEFGVARATVSRAMKELSDEGVIERRRKAGTRVRAAPVRHARFEMPMVAQEVAASGAEYGYKLLSREVIATPDWLAARLDLNVAEVVHVRCLHKADAAPFQVEDRWINAEVVPRVLAADFMSEGPNGWLVREVPFTDVEVAFSAEAASGWVAQALRVAEGEPVFCTERMTWLNGQPVTLARLRFGAVYRMVSTHSLG